MNHALKSEHRINLIVTSKHPRPQFYSIAEAEELVEAGLKVIDWASKETAGQEPDFVIAVAGTEPNLEALAALQLITAAFPEKTFRFVNVVDLLKLRHPDHDPRGISDEKFDEIFTTSQPIFFVFQGYAGLIRDLFYPRHNRQLSIHSYEENGDITTPFDMRVLNEIDRYHLARHIAAVVCKEQATAFCQQMDEQLAKHHAYIRQYGTDLPEVADWHWQGWH